MPGFRGRFVTLITRATWLVSIFLLSTAALIAEPTRTNILCRDNLDQVQREDLADKLKKISGWSDLRFDRGGMLRLGSKDPVGGSATARALLQHATFGSNFIVLEGASGSSEVAFSRVMAGQWKHDDYDTSAAFIVQIDFADFQHVIGDRRALQAFDAGWALLHELNHVVNDSVDANHPGETGECEDHINQMRRESNLPERADYFFTYLPRADLAFMTRFVRLAFKQEQTAGKKKRYWLVWDAKQVGGLNEERQTVALR